MKDSPIKRNFFAALSFAAIGALLFFVAMFLVNLYLDKYGGSNGERSWGLSFIVLQGVVFGRFLAVLDFFGIGNIKSKIVLSILSAVGDGVAMFFILFIGSLFWRFIVREMFKDER